MDSQTEDGGAFTPLAASPTRLATATWATERTLWANGSIWLGRDDKGVAVGCRDNRHLVTVAGSRAGKGVSSIVPNLCLWPGSCVVLDPKGENARLTARGRAARAGHRVVVLDPFGVSGMPEALLGGLNPLDAIDPSREDAIDLAASISEALVMPGDGRDVHWDESARQLIDGLILYVCTNEPAETATLAKVRELLTRGDAESAELYNGMEGVKPIGPFTALWERMLVTDAPNSAVQSVIAGAAESIKSMGENERGSVLSTARRNTKFLDSPAVARTLGVSTFSADALKIAAGGLSLYICLPARFMATHARFLRLVLNLILFRMEAVGLHTPACGHPVLFILDEFAALGRMEAIEKAAGLMAGYGVKLWPVLQDLTQLKRHYRESWETFLGNAGLIQFFGNTDLTTLEWISKRMGETEILRETQGASHQRSTSTSTSETHGRSSQSGSNEGRSTMAPLSSVATRQGGEDMLTLLSRSGASDMSVSQGSSKSEGLSASNQTGSGTSESETRSTNRAAHVRPLMRVEEIAKAFDRETGRQVVFIGGGAPLVLRRTPYYSDPQFEGLYAPLD